MSEETQTVTIDGIDYSVDDLTEKALYVISQMQYLSAKIEENKKELDRLQMASNAFSAVLKEEIAEVTIEVSDSVEQ